MFAILIQAPVIIFLTILFTVFVKIYGWKKGCKYSLSIFIVVLIFMMFTSGRAEYNEDKEQLNGVVYSLNDLDKKINSVAQDKNLKECFSEFPKYYYSYHLELGFLPNPDGPIVSSGKMVDRAFSVKGNGITALSDYTRFKLFKITEDKIVGNVYISIKPIIYKKEYFTDGLEEDRKYISYAYLDYRNKLELIIRKKKVLKEEYFDGKCDSGVQIENGGYNAEGLPIVFFTERELSREE